MLKNYGVIFNAQRLQYLWIFYKVFQDIYLKMKDCVEGGNVVFTQGLPADSDFGIKPERDDVGKLVFIDDLFLQTKGKTEEDFLSSLMLVRGHHEGLHLMYTCQNMPTGNKLLTSLFMQTDVFILTAGFINYVGLQRLILPGYPKVLTECARLCMEVYKRRYLVVDLTVTNKKQSMCKTGLLKSDEFPILFVILS